MGRHPFRCLSWPKSRYGLAACCVCCANGAQSYRYAESVITISYRTFVGDDRDFIAIIPDDLASRKRIRDVFMTAGDPNEAVCGPQEKEKVLFLGPARLLSWAILE